VKKWKALVFLHDWRKMFFGGSHAFNFFQCQTKNVSEQSNKKYIFEVIKTKFCVKFEKLIEDHGLLVQQVNSLMAVFCTFNPMIVIVYVCRLV